MPPSDARLTRIRAALSPSSLARALASRWAQRPPLRALLIAPDGTSPLLAVAGFGLVVWMIGRVVAPFFADRTHWGWHDWDMVASFRYLVVKSLKAYHQFPFWNPYACGGYTAWGYVESDTNLVSPWLPLYLLTDERIALRLEVVGTALLSAWGTWLLAGRFTRSAAARAFACVVFVVNGRWALQTASGHLMHCYYAWLPWVFYFFDRALVPGHRGETRALESWRDRMGERFSFACAAGAFVALMIYTGAIYPLPQSMVALLVYAILLAAAEKSPVPLALALLVATIGVGLGAPKLLPILDAFSKAPRLVDSKETMDLGAFITMLTSRDQDFDARPVHVPQWGWHEWGIYIGWAPFLVLLAAAISVRGRRESPLKWTAVILLLLGFGAFHDFAPWTLLHQVSIFRSQHVPSRWLYPAVLLFGVVAAAGIGRALDRIRARGRVWIDFALLAVVAAIAADIALVAELPMKRVFWMEMAPSLRAAGDMFHQESLVPSELHYVRRDWSVPSLPAMLSNVGVLECYSVVPMSIYAKNEAGLVPGQGAKGRGDKNYRGEVFTESGTGHASIKRWTPNEVEVEVEGAQAGDLLVMNQNYDAGWSANGNRTVNYHDTIGAKLVTGGNASVTFRYRPQTFSWGVGIFLLTVCTILVGRRRFSPGPLTKSLRSRPW